MTLKALIFDVDGTLADTEELHRLAFNAAFAEHDLPWAWSPSAYRVLLTTTGGKERIARFIAEGRPPAAEQARLARLIPLLHAAKTRCYTEWAAAGRAPLRAGIAALIDEARAAGLKLAIASTTTPANVAALIAATLGDGALGWFHAIAAGDAVAAKKPAPDIYRHALDLLQLPAAACIAFEDSALGVAAAVGAGLYTVATPNAWTAEDDFSAADQVLAALPATGALALLRRGHAGARSADAGRQGDHG